MHPDSPTRTTIEALNPDAYKSIMAFADMKPVLVLDNTMKALKDQVSKLEKSMNDAVPTAHSQTIQIGDINVTCPGVTSNEVMKQVADALNREFSGIALDALQTSMMR